MLLVRENTDNGWRRGGGRATLQDGQVRPFPGIKSWMSGGMASLKASMQEWAMRVQEKATKAATVTRGEWHETEAAVQSFTSCVALFVGQDEAFELYSNCSGSDLTAFREESNVSLFMLTLDYCVKNKLQEGKSIGKRNSVQPDFSAPPIWSRDSNINQHCRLTMCPIELTGHTAKIIMGKQNFYYSKH